MISTVHAIYENGVFRPVEPVSLPENTPVELELRTVGPDESAARPGEGILRLAGALADDPHWDGIMAEIQRERKHERRPQMEEP
jgi:predicted DNA-binding antitoxin AbrB/MazE fold protein